MIRRPVAQAVWASESVAEMPGATEVVTAAVTAAAMTKAAMEAVMPPVATTG